MWNSLLAGIVFQHPTIETLRRELLRNGQLRHLCGFRPAVIPPPSVYPRFLQRLLVYEAQIDQMFDALVEALRQSLPHFAEQLAGTNLGRCARAQIARSFFAARSIRPSHPLDEIHNQPKP